MSEPSRVVIETMRTLFSKPPERPESAVTLSKAMSEAMRPVTSPHDYLSKRRTEIMKSHYGHSKEY